MAAKANQSLRRKRGNGAIVIAFAVVGVAGISGMLAKLLYKADKLPGM